MSHIFPRVLDRVLPTAVSAQGVWITDADGKVEEIRGPGVVGQQPILAPGQSFEYTSACPLVTSFGVMQGSYQMVTPDGDHFEIAIAPFSLHEPYAIN